jgi:hypothetical protein
MSMTATTEALLRFGYRFTLHTQDGNCHVDDARNATFREFLCSDATDLFFIDSDMGWRAESVLRCLKAEGDIVGGLYRYKKDIETYGFHPGEDGARHEGADGLWDMPKIPTGFMRIRRHVIEELHKREVAKERCWWDNPEDEATGKPPIAAICERGFVKEMGFNLPMNDKSNRHSGDLMLCLKARNAGFSVRADFEMPFVHVGDKAYEGSFGSWLRAQQGVDAPRFAAAIQRIRDGHHDENAFQRLYDAFGITEWPLQGPALHELFHLVRNGSGDALETGSGLSTVVIALALEGTERACHALEHDALYFRSTATWLERYKLGRVNLHLSPIIPYEEASGRQFLWYLVEPGQLPESFGVALIDGPPHRYGRDGVFRIVGGALANASLMIDDAARERFDLPTHDIAMRVGNARTYAVATPKAAALAA